jgi:hypothetical protein
MEFIRALAVYPSMRSIGFAVLEEPDELIDWGVRTTRRDKNNRGVLLVNDLINRYKPDILIVEDWGAKGFRRSLRTQALMQDLVRFASRRKIKTRTISRHTVRKTFTRFDALTKYQIARVIATNFPELAPQMPPIRKPWMKEDYKMCIFDSVALSLTFFNAIHKTECKRKDAGLTS